MSAVNFSRRMASPPIIRSVSQFLATADGVPSTPARAQQPVKKFKPLEAYLGARFGIFDVAVGKQSLWWGPDEDSSFHFSNNAEPLLMARISQASSHSSTGPVSSAGQNSYSVSDRRIGRSSFSRSSADQRTKDYLSAHGESGSRLRAHRHSWWRGAPVNYRQHSREFLQHFQQRWRRIRRAERSRRSALRV